MSASPKLVRRDGTPVAVPAIRPIKFGGLHLGADGLTVHGKPDFDDFRDAVKFADYAEKQAPFWKADLIEYGHSRADWAEQLSQVIDAEGLGLTKESADTYRAVSRAYPHEERVEGLHFGHHQAAMTLPPADRRAVLEKAKRDALSVTETRQLVRKRRKVRRVLTGQASELATAFDRVVEFAHTAADLCREIPKDDGKKTLKLIAQAHRALDDCETAFEKYRKLQGGK